MHAFCVLGDTCAGGGYGDWAATGVWSERGNCGGGTGEEAWAGCRATERRLFFWRLCALSADQVWSVLRNFNNMDWADGIVESVESTNGKGGTEAGAALFVNGAIRETLQSFDDDAMAFSYSIDDGPDVLTRDKVTGYIG